MKDLNKAQQFVYNVINFATTCFQTNYESLESLYGVIFSWL